MNISVFCGATLPHNKAYIDAARQLGRLIALEGHTLLSSLAERKTYLLAHSDAFIALPGGIGTLDEVTEVMVANQLQHTNKPVVLINLDGYYDPFLQQLERFQTEGLMRSLTGYLSSITSMASLTSITSLSSIASSTSLC